MFKSIRSLSYLLFPFLLGLSAPAHATLTYNNWISNENPNGNYIFTIDHVGSNFVYNLTVSPWNAEALGIFIDLGAITVNNVGFSNLTPTAPMSLFATDTASNTCGQGCNLNGLGLPALGGGDWELVFRLGQQGFNGLQTFSWQTSDFGLSEAAFGLVGIRAQQLCSGTDVLPPNGAGNCGDSDKVYGYPNVVPTPTSVPEPGSLALLSLPLFGLAYLNRKRRSH